MNSTENKNYYMKEIPAKEARALVQKYHYSHKAVSNSKLHLGVFTKDTNELIGVLQYGYPMNPKKTPPKLVEGATAEEMYELNRMAMLDEAPKFSESQAIGLSIKYIKRYYPNIKWLLSYSDGKEGNVGTIYQATNWGYYGFNLSNSFYKLDNQIMHSIQVWHKFKEGKPEVTTMGELYKNFDNVSQLSSRQHVYIFVLDKKIKVLRDLGEYPKKETEPTVVKEVFYKIDGAVLPKRLVKEYI